jgi:hypothetical protein
MNLRGYPSGNEAEPTNFPNLILTIFSENMDNLKMTGSILSSILSQEPTFPSFFIYFIFLCIYFHQHFLILKNVRTAFEEKKHKNVGFDGTRGV